MATEAIDTTRLDTRRATGRRFRLSRDFGLSVVLGILGLLTFVPVIMLLELSFKDQQQMAVSQWLPALPLYIRNYAKAFALMWPYMINSVVFVVGAVDD